MIQFNVDFIYICRDQKNEELRYSIRSVYDNYPEAEVLVVGGKPDWYSGNFIEVKNIGNKFDNINQCYKTICNIKSIDNFTLMNDDFFILNRLENIPYYYDKTLDDKIADHTKRFGLSKYARVLSEANKILKKMGIEKPLNYDVHTPIVFNREKLSEIINLSKAPRSLYGNIFQVGGEEIKDVKVYKDTKEIDINKDFISCEDKSFEILKNLILADKFKNKTKYEV